MSADHAEIFERHRARLFGVAYRMLGSRADADDVLQESYLRWHGCDIASVQSPEAWLVTTATRLCLDRLRDARQERERYVGPWLPEPIATDTLPSPELQLELAHEVSVAFLAVLERLAPEERAVFLLREVFDYDYTEIAAMLGRTEAACRQMVHRARARVREGRPRFSIAAEMRERLLERFIAAAASGNRDAVMALLAEDGEYVSDGGGKVYAALRVLKGPERIARLFYCIARRNPHIAYRLIRVNGELGVLALQDGRVYSVLSFAMGADRIAGIYVMRNPDKLAGISIADFGK